MLIKKQTGIPSSEITSESQYLNRRTFLRGAALAASTVATGLLYKNFLAPAPVEEAGEMVGVGTTNDGATGTNAVDDTFPRAASRTDYAGGEEPNTYKEITTYNNYYEFGTDKFSPARLAKNFKTRPWTVSIEGLVNRPRVFDIDEILRLAPAEERIYRFRCVEAWSMTIPWLGFPLKELLSQVEPQGNAKYVQFVTLADELQMPNLDGAGLDFPYVEGLRLDEALHPLTLLAFGIYGKPLLGQNGAPLRLVVPWKYGYKSIKSIIKIKLVEQEPPTTWNISAPDEYGFYSNVNPSVDHPRWTQKTERHIGEFLRRPTLPFNGYADEVASLYSGMDLKKFY